MLGKMLRDMNWRDALLPIGMALLHGGLQHMEQRRNESEGRLAELEELITFRREQLSGARDLVDEPEPVDPEPETVPAGRTWLLAAGILLGLGAVMASRKVRPWLLAAFDEEADDFARAAFRGEVDPATMRREGPAPWTSTAATPARDSDTHVSCFGADGQCEHAPDGGNHPAAADS